MIKLKFYVDLLIRSCYSLHRQPRIGFNYYELDIHGTILAMNSGGGSMHDIGRILREGRLACGFEIGDIARRTCINARYLKAMEEGKFQIIPHYFDKGYLKIYATYLNMDAKLLLAQYEQNKNAATAVRNAEAQHA